MKLSTLGAGFTEEEQDGNYSLILKGHRLATRGRAGTSLGANWDATETTARRVSLWLGETIPMIRSKIAAGTYKVEEAG